MTTEINNEMILASAGSGKTYALTTRFIALLAAGVAPDRIAALTFTRKAAGEFFDEILVRLADAASSEPAAAKLARETRHSTLDRAAAGVLLRRMISATPRLTLGTMDSFFARVVSAFPIELGLAGEMQIIDPAEAAEETRRVMGRFFGVTRERGAAQDAVLEAFRLATMGAEAKTVTRILDRFLAEYFELHRRAGDPAAWGNKQRIWPGGFPWGGGADESAEHMKVLRAWIAGDGAMTDGQRARWENFVLAFEEWSPGVPWPDPLKYVVATVLKAGREFTAGGAPLTIDKRKQVPPAEARLAIAGLVRRVVALELGRRMVVTQGIGALLREFDAAYDADVRRSGLLTFADVLDLLGSSSLLGRGAGDAEARRAVEYRLDGRVDHWLLDEFQDTNRRQWDVLEGLIDEAVQDPTGSRSLFYVGDVKQAIFSWRGGDPRLFEHVAARYSRGGPRRIESRELNSSHRSGPEIIALVNEVFGSAAVADVFPSAAEHWARVWRNHETAVPGRAGQAAVLLAKGEEARMQAMLDIIRAIEPAARGLSCAVLVRKNDTATRFAEYLRREGVVAVAESDLLIGKDNPWSAAFVSLLWCAAHPGDSISWEHLMMTPARAWLGSAGVRTHDDLSRFVLREIGESGFEALATKWLEGMRGSLAPEDTFTPVRAAQLIAAARAFDDAGGGQVAAFIRWLDTAVVRESEGADVVRVMTIHKSKGLGFDVVILPDLEGGGLGARRDGPAVSTRDDGSVDWILEYPGKLIAEYDERLGAYLRAAQAEAAFESMALLYVALTRARHGLYAIIEPVGVSDACSYPRLLCGSLGAAVRQIEINHARFEGTASRGDAGWLPDRVQGGARNEWRPATIGGERGVVRVPRRVASADRERVGSIAEVFGVDRKARAAFGTAVHALLAEVEWADDLDTAAWKAAATERGVDPGVVKEAAGLLSAKATAGIFKQPGTTWEVWRERAFETLLDGSWVSAVPDRVCLARSEGGEIREARLYEFKTGDVRDATGNPSVPREHAEQLDWNRRVVAAATGLGHDRVHAALVYTKTCTMIVADGKPL